MGKKIILIIKNNNKILVIHNNEYINNVYILPSFDTNTVDTNASIIEYVHKEYSFDVIVGDVLFSDNESIWYETKPICKTEDLDCYNTKWITIKRAGELQFDNVIGDTLKEYISDYQNSHEGKIKLHFGLRNEKIIHISEILYKERGLACNCICPLCRTSLQARIGYVRQRHFAHDKAKCNIVFAQQTALHMLAKEILEESKKIMLPQYELEGRLGGYDEEILSYGALEKVEENYIDSPETLLVFDKVYLEKKLDNIIPDIVVERNGRKLIVEIAVTHFVDEEKLRKIKELNISTLEIDLSGFIGQDFIRDTIRNALLNMVCSKKWIYNTRYNNALEKLKERNKKIELDDIVKQKEQELAEEIERKQELRKIKRLQDNIENAIQIENYKKTVKSRRNDNDTNNFLKSTNFFRANNFQIPYYVDIPVSGEIAFLCDRRIWQSAIFEKFVFYRINDGIAPKIVVAKISKWIFTHQNIFKIDYKLAKKINKDVHGDPRNGSFVYNSLTKYLSYLAQIGFIDCCGNLYFDNEYNVVSWTTIPPNKLARERLQSIISDIKESTFDIDDEIDKRIYPRTTVDYSRPQISDEDRKSLVSNKYGNGKKEITKDFDINAQTQIYDSFDYRWLCCKVCGEIKREDEMADYQYCKGTCRECKRSIFNK